MSTRVSLKWLAQKSRNSMFLSLLRIKVLCWQTKRTSSNPPYLSTIANTNNIQYLLNFSVGVANCPLHRVIFLLRKLERDKFSCLPSICACVNIWNFMRASVGQTFKFGGRCCACVKLYSKGHGHWTDLKIPVRSSRVFAVQEFLMSMEIRLGLFELSVLSQVSAVEGCLLSGVAL